MLSYNDSAEFWDMKLRFLLNIYVRILIFLHNLSILYEKVRLVSIHTPRYMYDDTCSMLLELDQPSVESLIITWMFLCLNLLLQNNIGLVLFICSEPTLY